MGVKEAQNSSHPLPPQASSSSSHLQSTSNTSKIALGTRPTSVQKAIDSTFDNIKNNTLWHCNGDCVFYRILGLHEEMMLNDLALKKGKDDIYLIDVGCGKGCWGKKAMDVLLHNQACQKSEKHFYIFSITGGQECKKEVYSKDNVTHYIFNQFKIENIDEEFLKRGFDLKNKVDLIVSRWTLRHLVDPFGTLKRIYNLLTPLQGTLLAHGFFFMLNNSHRIEIFPLEYWNICNDTNAISLFCLSSEKHDTGQFLLMRTNSQELEIPLAYTGEMQSIDAYQYQCSSGVVTVFQKGLIAHGKRFYFDEKSYYCDEHNQNSKNLYVELRKRKLFDWQ